MEFEGRLLRVLPVRSGTSQKTGNEWKTLPFVFEYFEEDNKMYSSKVFLETMDHDIMRAIGQFVERGQDGKGIVENGCMRLKCDVKCRVGFSLNVQEFEGKTYNRVRCYKFEPILPADNTAGAAAQQHQPIQGAFGQQISQQAQIVYPPQEENDDLPF